MLKERFSPQLASLLSEDEWLIAQTAYVPAENLDWESRFCLVSGYMSSRGSEICGGSRPTLPMTCVHGVFDRSEAFMRELVNVPDWAKIKLFVNCAPIGVAGEIEDYLRVLPILQKRGFALSGQEWKKMAVPDDVPMELKPWYLKRQIYAEKMDLPLSVIHASDLVERVARDFQALKPLYQIMRGCVEEAMNQMDEQGGEL